MANKNNQNNNREKRGFFETIGGWCRRLFFGGANEYARESEEAKKKAATDDSEDIVSPGKQVVRKFFSRKLAVGALCVVIAMFILVIVGPMLMPKYTDSYTEVTQRSVPPGFNMMSVPSELKNDIKMIDSYGSFTVGLSNSGKVYVWGQGGISTTGLDMKDIPEEILNANIVMIAAGIDHAIAIDENGKIYGWGYNRFGQYGWSEEFESNPNIATMPLELYENGIDVSQIKKLACGNQCTAILMQDGTLYIWGNRHAYANLDSFLRGLKFKDISFTLNYVVAVPERGNGIYTGTRGLYEYARTNIGGEAVAMTDFLDGRKIESIVSTTTSICMVLDDGSVALTGDFTLDALPIPDLQEGEYFIPETIGAGTYHFSGITNLGNVYSWGRDTLNQASVPKNTDGATKLYVGAFQNYAVDDNDDLVAKWGLKGYLFGTDTYGADIFQRIINGGAMTMTVGAVAVIISSIIGIIIGCVSGYFGGKVDIALMRITEIVNAIPFLPFALILSAILSQVSMSSNMRILILMCILGVLTWTGLARLVRGQVLSSRESEYVAAAKAMGVKESRIAFKHILPNIMSVILVSLTLNFATCMLTEASFSYLGFGVPYPQPSWGNMLNGANNATVITNYWWQWVFTALFLSITTICINIVGDALRDVMDPKSNTKE
ncbi:MAG: ABC transporter permease subunit [Clostridia bacterium]|nr:ABC transporter permease subunit [Clostridia bacterium]